MADEREDEQGGGGIPFNPAYAKYDGMTLIQLGQAMEEVRTRLDAAKEVKTELEKEYDFLCTVKIPPAMEDSGLQNFRLESGKGVRVQDEVFVSLKAGDLPPMKAWLQEQGDEAIIKETINSSTLKSYITGRIKAGKEYPAELVKVSVVPKARFF
jgi:hypothetical protein